MPDGGPGPDGREKVLRTYVFAGGERCTRTVKHQCTLCRGVYAGGERWPSGGPGGGGRVPRADLGGGQRPRQSQSPGQGQRDGVTQADTEGEKGGMGARRETKTETERRYRRGRGTETGE